LRALLPKPGGEVRGKAPWRSVRILQEASD
jgi:hypothetical protein